MTTIESLQQDAFERVRQDFPAARSFTELHDHVDANAEYLEEAFEFGGIEAADAVVVYIDEQLALIEAEERKKQ